MMATTLPPALAELASITDRPGFVASKDDLKRARAVRSQQRRLSDLYDGAWRKILLDERVTQHRWPKTKQFGAQLAELVVKLNLVRVGVDMHAAVLVGDEPKIQVEGENPIQSEYLKDMKRAGLWYTFNNELATRLYREGQSFVRIDIARHRRNDLYIPRLEKNERTFGFGSIDEQNQHEVVERRWIIERPDPTNDKKTVKFLRVERHRVIEIDGQHAGIVEQEAYAEKRGAAHRSHCTIGADVLLDLAELRRVPLAEALGEKAEGMSPVRLTGLDHNSIVRFVLSAEDGDAVPLVLTEDLDLLDAFAASMSRIIETHEKHARPKMRVSQEMINPETGKADVSRDALVDPHKEIDYIVLEAQLEQMLALCDRLTSWVLIQLRMSQALIGFKPGGGASPDTAEKMRIESVSTLSRARQTNGYYEPMLERLVDTACELQSLMPLQGMAVSQVNITVRPELPKDPAMLVEEVAARLREGLIDLRTALGMLYEESEADRIYEAIEEERANRPDPFGLGSISPPFQPTNAEQGAVVGESGEGA